MSVDVSDLKAAVADWIDAGCAAAAAELGGQLDVPVKTGALLASQQVDTGGGGFEWSGSLAFTEDYASYTDTGSDPHRIEGNPLLAFEMDGDLVIVHSVNHPGSPGTRWFEDGASDEMWAQAVEANLGDLG